MTPPCGHTTLAQPGCSEQGLGGAEGADCGRGKPLAKPVPVQQAERRRVRDAIAAWRRVGLTLGGADWKELRDAGRR